MQNVFYLTDVLCGYTAAYLAGTIRSVDTDRDGFYDPDSVCIWVITPVYPNQLIQVFVEEMDIQNTFRCGSDHLKVLFNFSLTVKAAPLECVIRTGKP